MSTPFDRPGGPSGPDRPQRAGGGGQRPTSRRPGALVLTAIILIVAFMLLSGFAAWLY